MARLMRAREYPGSGQTRLVVLLEHGGQGISSLLKFGLLQSDVQCCIRQLKFQPVERSRLPDDIGQGWGEVDDDPAQSLAYSQPSKTQR